MFNESFRVMRIAAVLAATMMAGCVANPNKTAQTPEQHADALYGEYVIAKEQANVLVSDVSITDELKRPIAQAAVDSKQAADGLESALVAYTTAKADLSAGGKTTNDQLLVISNSLDDWIKKATPLINALNDAVAKAHK